MNSLVNRVELVELVELVEDALESDPAHAEKMLRMTVIPAMKRWGRCRWGKLTKGIVCIESKRRL